MKRRVKKFNRKKSGKNYEYYWIGYQTRNEKGTSYFVREINITDLPLQEIKRIDLALRSGKDTLVSSNMIKYESSIEIGSYWAILRICEDLGLYAELEKHLSKTHFTAVMGMITDRVANPSPYSKRMLSDAFPKSGLARILNAGKVPFNDWYNCLDELYINQESIERELANSREISNTLFMYDITSIYFEGDCCPLAEFGYNRDGKKGKKQIVVGMLTDSDGRPLSVRVFKGNTKDESTVLEQMGRIKREFNVENLIFVGDRGMVTGSIRDELQCLPESGIDYITALKRKEILKLVEEDNHPLQASLFDAEIAEVTKDDIRYILCCNPIKRDEDKVVRQRLIAKTEEKLAGIERNVKNGRLKKEQAIAKRLYTWLNRWGVGYCFDVQYNEGEFKYNIIQNKIDDLERLDGCYVITTTVSRDIFNKEQIVDQYKNLTWVEQIFRHMKTTDEFTRPIRHWNSNRVKGHVFMCMLAYLVIWQSRNAFHEFLDRDESNMCEAGSLREIWEALDHGISIGRISVAGEIQEQLSPIPLYQKRLLAAVNAKINKKEKERLNVM